MIGFWPMRVALLLTLMLVAVEIMAAGILAVESSRPALGNGICAVCLVGVEALLLVSSIFTEDIFLDLPAIASGWHSHFASAAETFMA